MWQQPMNHCTKKVRWGAHGVGARCPQLFWLCHILAQNKRWQNGTLTRPKIIGPREQEDPKWEVGGASRGDGEPLHLHWNVVQLSIFVKKVKWPQAPCQKKIRCHIPQGAAQWKQWKRTEGQAVWFGGEKNICSALGSVSCQGSGWSNVVSGPPCDQQMGNGKRTGRERGLYSIIFMSNPLYIKWERKWRLLHALSTNLWRSRTWSLKSRKSLFS